MTQRLGTDVVRRASGLPEVGVLRDPARAARVQQLAGSLDLSPVLPGLVRLTAKVAGVDCAQLSLLADEQHARSVRCPQAVYSHLTSALEDSLCTVTVLSGDVLLAADARSHPWLHDLEPVRSGAVGAYLGVPLRLADGTAVGALCAYGSAPHEWSQSEVGLTCEVADVVAAELRRLAA